MPFGAPGASTITDGATVMVQGWVQMDFQQDERMVTPENPDGSISYLYTWASIVERVPELSENYIEYYGLGTVSHVTNLYVRRLRQLSE